MPRLPESPRNHNDLNLSIQIFEALRPGRMILTHIGHEMDAWLLDNTLPYEEIRIARDEMTCN
ncbi:hypothetical protein [Pontibacterium sp.]|uniref:hypothetical protein n=1 Tax=Pontibacterium sp. TaxID=2036026 RepID=UPI003569D4CF